MNDQVVLQIGRDTMATMLLLMGPPLLVALVVGVLISVLQAATQVQEMTLTFVPKIVAVFLAMVVCGPWLMSTMLAFTQRLFTGFPDLIR
ncbi:MAG: flagellar biosynthesis protein FliQ [Armatimonadetes bacterium]|nr:flagellar biosynthesis protein FliQ [Armatimonadota bacterium]